MSERGRGPIFNAKGTQYNAYAERGDAMLSIPIAGAGGIADVAILAELRALRDMLAQLEKPSPSSAALVEAAEKEAKEPKPDRAKVAGYVESAVKLASGANNLAEQSDKLIPRLIHISSWVGQTWDAWRPSLGL